MGPTCQVAFVLLQPHWRRPLPATKQPTWMFSFLDAKASLAVVFLVNECCWEMRWTGHGNKAGEIYLNVIADVDWTVIARQARSNLTCWSRWWNCSSARTNSLTEKEKLQNNCVDYKFFILNEFDALNWRCRFRKKLHMYTWAHTRVYLSIPE